VTRVALALFASALSLGAAPKYQPPGQPLPALPVIEAVTVEAAADTVTVIEDVLLEQGAYQRGDLVFFVSFGLPGLPLAFDARVFPGMTPDASDAERERGGEAAAVERAARKPLGAEVLLGRGESAGVTIRVRDALAKQMFAVDGKVRLRIREVHAAPPKDEAGHRQALIRLGTAFGEPLTLGHVYVSGSRSASAMLCGAEADTTPIVVYDRERKRRLFPEGDEAIRVYYAQIDPSQALRHKGDDLCVTF
jgi:hypothetical protein